MIRPDRRGPATSATTSRPPRSATRTRGSGPRSGSPPWRPTHGPRGRAARRGRAVRVVVPRGRGAAHRPAVDRGGGDDDEALTGTARDYPRTARLNELLHEIVAEELERIDDERLDWCTITRVDVEPDLRRAPPSTTTRSAPRTSDDGRARGARRRTAARLQARHRPPGPRSSARPSWSFRPDAVIRQAERIERDPARPRRTVERGDAVDEPVTGGRARRSDAPGPTGWRSSTSRPAGLATTSWPRPAACSAPARSATPAPSTPTPPACCCSASAGPPACCASSGPAQDLRRRDRARHGDLDARRRPARSPAPTTWRRSASPTCGPRPRRSPATSCRCRRWCRP